MRHSIHHKEWGGWALDAETRELVYPPQDYALDLDDARSSARVLDWIAQVAGKTWATNACLSGLVRALDDVLQLQSTLCSSGRGQPLSYIRIAALVRNAVQRGAPEERGA